MEERATERMRADVVIFSDYVCPFCYVAEAAIARLRADGVVVQRRAFELRPPSSPLPDLDAGHYRAAFERAVLPLAQRAGVEIRFPALATRTRKAHEAAAHARDAGKLEAMHDAIFRAYFVEGRDIGRIDVLVAIGESVGLDRTGLKVALDIDKHAERVAADNALAAAFGITAVPAFVRERDSGHEIQLGAREYRALRRWLRDGTEGRRTV
ncbi:MAG: DsbA family oxidoreductase [Longimicrobiales bacterium]